MNLYYNFKTFHDLPDASNKKEIPNSFKTFFIGDGSGEFDNMNVFPDDISGNILSYYYGNQYKKVEGKNIEDIEEINNGEYVIVYNEDKTKATNDDWYRKKRKMKNIHMKREIIK